MRSWCWWSIAPGALCFALAKPASATPERKGFTADVGLGLAITTIDEARSRVPCNSGVGCTTTESTNRESAVGLAALSLSLGGFVDAHAALLFRTAGTLFIRGGELVVLPVVHRFLGPAVEVWPHDRFYLGAGVGLALLGLPAEPKKGWAFDLRAGAALVRRKDRDFTISFEVLPGFYEGATITGYGLVGAWKWY